MSADIRKIVLCYALSERLMADIYDLAANKANDPALKALLRFMAIDSRKHEYIFRMIAEQYGMWRINESECSRVSGLLYGLIGSLKEARESVKKATDDEKIKKAIIGLEEMQRILGESEIDRIVQGLTGEDKEVFTKLLILIKSDQEKHEKLIGEFLSA
jgi:rubrerythrin